MADSTVTVSIDSRPPPAPMTSTEKSSSLKRKRERRVVEILSEPERERRIEALNSELRILFDYFNEMMRDTVVREADLGPGGASGGLNGMIAVLLEEKRESFGKLVEEVYGKVEGKDGGVGIGSVRSGVLFVGQRVCYGVPDKDADVLEDETESCLWCWETRELKFLPAPIRGMVKARRTCRKKINERISAILAVISALQRSENHRDVMKASEKLNKVLNEADIRLLAESLSQRTGSDMAEKGIKQDEKIVIQQLEKNKRELEKEKKRMDHELQKEKLRNEKEQKRLQDEAAKDEKLREKEESEIKRQLKRKQEEAERDQRRREKEEAERKKQRSIQKQASIMESFLKKRKTTLNPEIDNPIDAKLAGLSTNVSEVRLDLIASVMDSALSNKDEIAVVEIRRSHINSWHSLGLSVRSRRNQHWGLRRKPKAELIKELKLTSNKCLPCDEDMIMERMVDEWGRANENDGACSGNADSFASSQQKRQRRRQLLQFDKSCRPAFCGTWPKKSSAVGPRHPLKKDPDLDYDVDSDEEWEEEEPGESLSDCEKDEEDSLDEPCTKVDEEDESDDGFFVPDGYLSENEGVDNDRAESIRGDQFSGTPPSCEPEADCTDYSVWIRQQKYLQNLTEHALRKNQPLFIINLMHDKSSFLPTEDLSGTLKLEQMCLQALAIRALSGCLPIEVPSDNYLPEESEEVIVTDSKEIASTLPIPAIPDEALPTIASTIQSCPYGMNKVLESLQQKFPDIPKTHLRNKVREIADFVDNRWQVKKEVVDKLGLLISPERTSKRTKSIASFFSKRCLPPVGGGAKPLESSPESYQKSPSVTPPLLGNCTYNK
ncbi:hypothetical protein Droror1_Dr00025200 [Drosera rotundifolia]